MFHLIYQTRISWKIGRKIEPMNEKSEREAPGSNQLIKSGSIIVEKWAS